MNVLELIYLLICGFTTTTIVLVLIRCIGVYLFVDKRHLTDEAKYLYYGNDGKAKRIN